MQDRVQAIEDEYDRRLGELVEWRMAKLASARGGERETFAVGTNQFHIEYGMSACTAAATAAALYVLMYIAPEEGVVSRDVVPNLPWDTIVETGARLWLEYAGSDAGGANPSGHVDFDQLLGCGGKFCATVKRALETVLEIAGHTDDAVVAAMDPDALPKTLAETVAGLPQRSAGIITATSIDVHGDGHGIGATAAADARAPPDNNNEDGDTGVGVTLAVMRLHGESAEYWIYDSHGGVDTETAALLCRCTTAETAAEVLRELLPTGLFCATIVKRRRARS